MTGDQEREITQVRRAIAALESQRQALGDSVVDASIAALNKQLVELEGGRELPEQHRKLVTILFTDVVGSTRISRELDPEEMLDFMDSALKRLAKPVEDHSGHVSRFQGDGFKAIFGLPAAHENDPEMAIRAGLEILEASREIGEELDKERGIPGFQVRVGINTGLVASGGQTEAEDTVMGDAINLAARLESAAPPGGVLISHNTYRHVRGIFNVEQAEPVAAKGFPEPVPAYVVRSAKPRAFRVVTRGVEGIETRMIGRESEESILQDAFFTTVEEGEGHVVTVIGEAGVGKSRLLYEFQNWIELVPRQIRLYLGRARQESQNLPYALLRDLFAHRFQIQDGDPAEVIREKFQEGIQEAEQLITNPVLPQASTSWRTDMERQTWETRAHLLGQLIGFDYSDSPHLSDVLQDPQSLRNRAFESLVDYFASMCQLDPVVIFLEDIHWAEDSSLDAINLLGRRFQKLPVLIVGVARPSLIERRPYWGEGQLNHRKITLDPLSKRESRRLVGEILQKIELVPDALRELVVTGSEGNPFYIEELIKMLVEQGVIVKSEPRWYVETERMNQVGVPTTLTGVLQARLDSLPRDERAALQQASVVGRVFWDRVIQFIQSQENGARENLETVLDGLRHKEMVFLREESTFSQTREYIFKHEMLRDVTYETVLKKLRQLYHGWVANWLIEHGDEGGEDYSGLIASHLLHAGNGAQALVYLQQAGEAALASYANAEASHYFRQALELHPPEPDRPRLLDGLAEALQSRGYWNEAFQAWKEGIAIHQANGDLESVARFYTSIIRYLLPDSPNEAIEQVKDSLDSVIGLQESSTLGRLLHQCARAYYFSGDAQQAEPLCRRALEISEKYSDLELQADTLVTLGTFNFIDFEEGIADLERGVELAEENHYLYIAERGHNNLAGQYFDHLSNIHFALSHCQRALEIARQVGAVQQVAFQLFKLIGVNFILGNLQVAKEEFSKFEEVIQEIPQPELMISRLLEVKGKLASLQGQLGEAFELFQESLAEARSQGPVQNSYYITLNDLIPLVLDMNRFEGWNNWGPVEEAVREIVPLAIAADGILGEANTKICLSILASRQGLIEPAGRWLESATSDHQPASHDLIRTRFTTAEVELSIAEERWEDALSGTNSLLEWYSQAGMRWDLAHTLLDLAEIHILRNQPGDREKAVELYRESRELFEEMGAQGYVEIIQNRLQNTQL